MKENDFSLEISIRSYFGPSYRFGIEGVRGRAEKTRDGETIFNKEIELSKQNVRLFAERIMKLGVFSWEVHYIQCCMLDGTSWNVKLTWGDRRLWSTGTNGYPPQWPEFVELLLNLLGLEKDFYPTMTGVIDFYVPINGNSAF